LFGIHRAAQAGKLRMIDSIGLARLIRKLGIRSVLKARETKLAAKRGGHGHKKRAGVTGGMPRAVQSRNPVKGIHLVDVDELADQLVDPAAAPEDVAAAGDEAERIYRMLEDPSWPEIARLRLEGHSLADIALRTGLAVSSVERRFSKARALWEASRGPG